MAGGAGKYRGAARKRLYEPVLNLTLGQKYVDHLLDESQVNGDLIMLGIAYNAGPGVLPSWRAKAKETDDPLLFLATLPVRQTRVFVERVLTNYWIYQQRFEQESPSLDALVAGEWPRYVPAEAVAAK
jgi:soluble lytic murein transglycosylase-like protein